MKTYKINIRSLENITQACEKLLEETKKWKNGISHCTINRYDSEEKLNHQINEASDAAYKVNIKSNRNIKTTGIKRNRPICLRL